MLLVFGLINMEDWDSHSFNNNSFNSYKRRRPRRPQFMRNYPVNPAIAEEVDRMNKEICAVYRIRVPEIMVDRPLITGLVLLVTGIILGAVLWSQLIA